MHAAPWTRNAFAQRLRWARQKAKLPLSVTLHGIRHLWGSLGVARGGNLKMVSVSLGHRNVATTERYYLHLDEQTDALRAVSELAARREV